MNETEPTAQEGNYQVRNEENDKIRDILKDGIESDRRVFAVIRERLPEIYRKLTARTPQPGQAGA